MCYHVSTASVRALKNVHKDGFRIADESMRYGAYDRPLLPATLSVGQVDFSELEWPLIPHWAKDLEHARFLQSSGYNAKAETMFEKPMFRDAAIHGRCLIWLNGFYEWQHISNKKKVQYFIHLPGGALFAVGGLMSSWQNPQGGERFHTCTIVTTEANTLMTEIHNSKKRMPLILPEQATGIWLDPRQSKAEIAGVCKPFEDGLLQAEMVDEAQEQDPQRVLF